jgi:hypothetical protein
MIRPVKAYTDSKGITHPDLPTAQAAEIRLLLEDNTDPTNTASYIVANSDKFIDVLTTTETSRPAARRVNGGKKPRKAKTDAEPVAT